MTTVEEKLQHAQEWMRREVVAQKEHLWEKTRSEEEILETLQNYFSPEVHIHLSDTILQELIWSELLYDVQWEHHDIDGSAIILWYQKVFDTLVEKYITKALRKYIKQYWELPSPQNIPLEKFLFQVVEKWFILSSGRLFELLKNTKNNTQAYYFENTFRDFFNKNTSIKKCLLESNFLLHLEHLMKKKILWEKRHSGIVSREDTQFARHAYIWALEERDSLLSLTAGLWRVDG